MYFLEKNKFTGLFWEEPSGGAFGKNKWASEKWFGAFQRSWNSAKISSDASGSSRHVHQRNQQYQNHTKICASNARTTQTRLQHKVCPKPWTRTVPTPVGKTFPKPPTRSRFPAIGDIAHIHICGNSNQQTNYGRALCRFYMYDCWVMIGGRYMVSCFVFHKRAVINSLSVVEVQLS